MPPHVDHAARRREIVESAFELLAEGGLRAVAIRAVAARLGGSASIVTHYYPSRRAIFEDMANQLIIQWAKEVKELDDATSSHWNRLRAYIHWALPTRPRALMTERARVQLAAAQASESTAKFTFRAFDSTMRNALAEHLSGLLPEGEVDLAVEFLRVLITGVVLLTVEHGDEEWTPIRQMAVVDYALNLLGIEDSSENIT